MPLPGFVGDDLGRAPYAGRIADTIIHRADTAGIVFGIYGKWGDGKTSVLNMIADRVRGGGQVVVPFNPWYVRGEEQLIVTFFAELAAHVGIIRGKAAEKLGKFCADYGSVVAAVSAFPGGELVKGLVKVGQHLAEKPLEARRKNVEDELRRLATRVVVLVDDIDRLDRDGVYAMVKLVKLTANLPYITFVLAFDDLVVSHVLADRYPDDETDMGTGYLEKIVQVPLHLPAVSVERMREHFDAIVHKAASVDGFGVEELVWRDVRAHLEPLVDAAPRTLRMAKRLANAIAFGLPLVAESVHVGDFILLESIRAMYPRAYRSIRMGKASLVGVFVPSSADPERTVAGGEVEGLRKAIVFGLSQLEFQAVWRVVQRLFPRVNLAEAIDGQEAQWNRDHRVASPLWFDYYFTFAEPPVDVVAEEFQELRRSLELGKRAEAASSLRDLLMNDPGGAVAHELGIDAYWRTETMALCLLDAISAAGDLLAPRIITPDNRASLRGSWADSTSASWLQSPRAMMSLLTLVLRSLTSERQRAWGLQLAQGNLCMAILWAEYRDAIQRDGSLSGIEVESVAEREQLTGRCQQWMLQGRDLRWVNPDEAFVILRYWGRVAGPPVVTSVVTTRWGSQYVQAATMLDLFARAQRVDVTTADPDTLAEHVFRPFELVIEAGKALEPLRKVLAESDTGSTEAERQASHREHVVAQKYVDYRRTT